MYYHYFLDVEVKIQRKINAVTVAECQDVRGTSGLTPPVKKDTVR